MPQTNTSKRPAQKTRKAPATGRAGQEAICQQGAGEQVTDAIIANSLGALRLGEKKGTEVFYWQETVQEGEEYVDGMFYEMVDDLWLVYKAMQKSFGIELLEVEEQSPTFPALNLMYLLRNIQTMLPAGFEFNIEYSSEHDHYITVYHECPFREQWNVFTIKDLVKILKRQNTRLHDLFLSFIRAFSKATGVDMWWQGYCGNTIDILEENMDNMLDDMDEASIDEWMNEIALYKCGPADKYKRLIMDSRILSADDIIQELSRFRKAPQPIVELIQMGCELMNGNINDYIYMHNEDYEGCTFLRYDLQHNIIWKADGPATTEHEAALDMEAQEGLQQPIWSMAFTKDFKGPVDTSTWNEAIKWPMCLNQYFNQANDLIKTYTDE